MEHLIARRYSRSATAAPMPRDAPATIAACLLSTTVMLTDLSEGRQQAGRSNSFHQLGTGGIEAPGLTAHQTLRTHIAPDAWSSAASQSGR